MSSSSGRKNRARAVLLTLTFYPLMVAWTVAGIALSPAAIAILKTATGWEIERVIRYLIKVHGRGLLTIVSPFVRLEKENLEGIPHPCILVANHLSYFDGYYMAALPFFDLTFAVGAWPFRMYWYTTFMRLARYLDLENMSWQDAVTACRKASSKKGSILFFPEGHRSRSGRLEPFFSGAFRMSIETGLPVVPICIAGTDVLLPPGKRLLHPARVRLKALPAVHPADFDGPAGPAKMRNSVRRTMAGALMEMQAEPS